LHSRVKMVTFEMNEPPRKQVLWEDIYSIHDSCWDGASDEEEDYEFLLDDSRTDVIEPVNSSSCLEVTSLSSSNNTTTDNTTGDDGDVDDDNEDEDDDEDIDSKIEFLQEKQWILKRAFDAFRSEDNYEASNALLLQKGMASKGIKSTNDDPENSIWTRAKALLADDQLVPSSSSSTTSITQSLDESSSYGSTAPPVSKSNNKKNTNVRIAAKTMSNPRDLLIDLTCVEQCSSMRHDDITHIDNGRTTMSDAENELLSSSPAPLPFKVHWMAKALVRAGQDKSSSTSSKSLVSPQDSGTEWRVAFDYQTNLTSLLAPKQYHQEEYITLQEAIIGRNEPRLITQAIPPFNIVFANAAFLRLASLTSQEKLIGTAVEGVLQVINRANIGGDDGDDLHVRILGDNSKRRMIIVTGIQDRSKRRRVEESSMNTSRFGSTCITHILVRFSTENLVWGDAESNTTTEVRVPTVSTNAIEKDRSELIPPKTNIPFGTVG
jgi:hypothetical protein